MAACEQFTGSKSCGRSPKGSRRLLEMIRAVCCPSGKVLLALDSGNQVFKELGDLSRRLSRSLSGT